MPSTNRKEKSKPQQQMEAKQPKRNVYKSPSRAQPKPDNAAHAKHQQASEELTHR